MNKLVDLYEYVADKQSESVGELIVFSEGPEKISSKLRNELEQVFDGSAKEIILNSMKEWFKNNPKRRNIKAISHWSVTMYLLNNSDKILIDVSKELDRIGVVGPCTWWSMIGKDGLGGNVSCGQGTIELTTATEKQFREGTYKYTRSDVFLNNLTFSPSKSGNGYNDLPAEDMSVLRRKFWDCMSGVTCDVECVPGYRLSKTPIPNFNINLIVNYDKGKLKSFLKELQNDRRLQNYAERHEAMGRGIAAYYASKGPGDYVGD